MYAKRTGRYTRSLPARDRAITRIARRARLDVIYGGARALVLAERAERMGLPLAHELRYTVDLVYSVSSYHLPAELDVWECTECGTSYVGFRNAEDCCLDQDWSYDDEEEENDSYVVVAPHVKGVHA
jgi:hypothetical protein